jgi:hypothetical protein
MKHIKILIYIFLLIYVTETLGQPNNFKKGCYNIKINYEDLSARLKSNRHDYTSNDSLYIFLETGFNNDIFEFYINNDLVRTDTVTTMDMLGLSDVLIYKISKVENFGFRFNNGKYLLVEINALDENKWSIYYVDGCLYANILDRAPFYE